MLIGVSKWSLRNVERRQGKRRFGLYKLTSLTPHTPLVLTPCGNIANVCDGELNKIPSIYAHFSSLDCFLC